MLARRLLPRSRTRLRRAGSRGGWVRLTIDRAECGRGQGAVQPMLAAAVQLPAPTGRRLGLGFHPRPRPVRMRGLRRPKIRLVLGALPTA